MAVKHRVLVIDDDSVTRVGVRAFLESHHYAVDEAASLESGERVYRSTQPDAVLLDYMLPDGNALDLLPKLKEMEPDLPVVVLTAHGSIERAVRAVRLGAEHFLTKPVDFPALAVILKRLLDNARNRKKQRAQGPSRKAAAVDPFVGTSDLIRQLATEARQVALTDSPVLILGETGTGKGVLARWLHDQGPRADEAWVDLNCAGLTTEFLETELFGHGKGAFTGAVSAKMGLLEVAHHGTVFLDEIGDMEARVQPKLLKVLEEKRFRRLGEVRDRSVDIRLIAATHQQLLDRAHAQTFRGDLYFRISTMPLHVPPLRERSEDLPHLARQLLAGLAAQVGRVGVTLDDRCDDVLASYPWPGNVRELRNVLERALLLSPSSDVVETEALRLTDAAPPRGVTPSLDLTLAQVERQHIERVLHECGGHVGQAAQRLNIPRSTLYLRLKKHGLGPDRAGE